MLRPWSRSRWYRIESMGLRGVTRSDGPCEPATNRVNRRGGRPPRTRFGVGRRRLGAASAVAILIPLLEAQPDRSEADAERLFVRRLLVQLLGGGGDGAVAAERQVDANPDLVR